MSMVKEAEATEKTAAVEAKCVVQKARLIWVDFLQDEAKMCGKCHPCMLGTFEVIRILDRLSEGEGNSQDVEFLKTISTEMLLGSRCKKGKDMAKALAEDLKNSGEELEEHFLSKKCRHHECKPLVHYRINADKCTLCGKCLEACKYTAIAGEKKRGYFAGYLPYRVRETRCTRCDLCRQVCPEDAVEVYSGNLL